MVHGSMSWAGFNYIKNKVIWNDTHSYLPLTQCRCFLEHDFDQYCNSLLGWTKLDWRFLFDTYVILVQTVQIVPITQTKNQCFIFNGHYKETQNRRVTYFRIIKLPLFHRTLHGSMMIYRSLLIFHQVYLVL